MPILAKDSRGSWEAVTMGKSRLPPEGDVQPGWLRTHPRPFSRGDALRTDANAPLSPRSPLCSHNYVRGSITLYIINLHRSRKKIKLAGTLRDKIVHQYLLQPYGKDGLHSK